ncbi:MAG: phosphoglycerate mutase [Rhodospirillaceae bacterium]|nr:phosphoglycerate mutase [Rhodospirillaceae bacterium]|tara:strand:- start:198 stop:800 length:603 start_codon:yes stop_codon:yes gene_type:complete
MIMQGPLYLLRHGETVWNRAKRLQGHKDTPLTLKGVKQATALGNALGKIIEPPWPQYFYASPIGRARQTAVIIADMIAYDSEKIIHHDSLKEITFGNWDGLNMEEILANDAEKWAQRKDAKWQFSPPNGESYEQAGLRVASFFSKMPTDHPIIIVAHGSLNKVIRGQWLKLRPDEILALDEPQDGFYYLTPDGKETFIKA